MGLLAAALLTGSSVRAIDCDTAAAAATTPPDVVLVTGDGDAADYSVLFAGDGFKSQGDLEKYGAAVQGLAEGLADVDPFGDVWQKFSFYRIDVIDATGVIGSNCPNLTIDPLDEVELLGELVPGGTTIECDLGCTLCWHNVNPALGDTQILYTHETYDAFALSAFAPVHIDAMVIVADSRRRAGAARVFVDEGETPVVAIGVDADEVRDGVYQIGQKAVALFAHELGHALGLLDEYDHLQGLDPTDFRECRNVWRPGSPPPAAGGWPTSAPAIPWQSRLGVGCDPTVMKRCQGVVVVSPPDCPLAGITQDEAKCAFVTYAGADLCGPPQACKAEPGAWEGAFYVTNDHYRSEHECLMESISIDRELCEGCLDYLAARLCEFGPGTAGTSCPPPEARCSDIAPLDSTGGALEGSEGWCEATYGLVSPADCPGAGGTGDAAAARRWRVEFAPVSRYLQPPRAWQIDGTALAEGDGGLKPARPKTCRVRGDLLGGRVERFEVLPLDGGAPVAAKAVRIASRTHTLEIERRLLGTRPVLEWWLTENSTRRTCLLRPSGSVDAPIGETAIARELFRLGIGAQIMETKTDTPARALLIEYGP